MLIWSRGRLCFYHQLTLHNYLSVYCNSKSKSCFPALENIYLENIADGPITGLSRPDQLSTTLQPLAGKVNNIIHYFITTKHSAGKSSPLVFMYYAFIHVIVTHTNQLSIEAVWSCHDTRISNSTLVHRKIFDTLFNTTGKIFCILQLNNVEVVISWKS